MDDIEFIKDILKGNCCKTLEIPVSIILPLLLERIGYDKRVQGKV
jgi:hypothetical protein